MILYITTIKLKLCLNIIILSITIELKLFVYATMYV